MLRGHSKKDDDPDRPPGAVAPATVRPNSRAPKGPHIAGLEADFAERPWGVDLKRALNRPRDHAR